MLILANVISVAIANTRRLIKARVFSRTREVQQALPYGIDSAPINTSIAAFADTADTGAAVVIGYVYKDAIAAAGESRLYSTNSSGAFQFQVHLKANGEVLIGTSSSDAAYTNFLAKYNGLETAFNELKGKHNDLVIAFNSHMHPTAATGSPSIPTPIPGSIPAIPSAADITTAKATKIKTN